MLKCKYFQNLTKKLLVNSFGCCTFVPTKQRSNNAWLKKIKTKTMNNVTFLANIVGGNKTETIATILKTENKKRHLKIYWTCPFSKFVSETSIPYQENIFDAF
jgi:hypothetical protein